MFPGPEHLDRRGQRAGGQRQTPGAEHVCPDGVQRVRSVGIAADVPQSSSSVLCEQHPHPLLQPLHPERVVWTEGQRHASYFHSFI